MQRINRIQALILLACLLLSLNGCAGPEDATSPTAPDLGGLICMEYSRYTGTFPEDGSGRQVSNAAAILVRNSSSEYLDYATVECDVGGQIGTFYITGLPPGGTVWVLEQSGMSINAGDSFAAIRCQEYYFRPDAVMRTDQLSVKADGNSLTVTNVSDKTLENVCVYYKTVHSDDNYFGGITYMLVFGNLEPGASAQKQSAHFGANSKIVRYSFQEA